MNGEEGGSWVLVLDDMLGILILLRGGIRFPTSLFGRGSLVTLLIVGAVELARFSVAR